MAAMWNAAAKPPANPKKPPPRRPRFGPDSAARFIAFLVLPFVLPVAATAAAPMPEAGRPFVRVYAPAESGIDDDVVCATQDATGVMFFGTRGAVVEFDGETWQHLPVPTTGLVQSIVAMPSGEIWLVTPDELGCLVPSPAGGRTYRSHAAEARTAFAGFDPIAASLVAAGAHLWVSASGALLRWDGTAFASYPLHHHTRFDLFDLGPDGVIAHAMNAGVVRLGSGAPEPQAGSMEFSAGVSWLSPRPAPERWLVAPKGRPLGLVRAGGEERIEPLPGRFEDIVAGARMPDGGHIFLRKRGGVLALDPQLRVRWEAGTADGIPLERVHRVFVDRARGVWVCTGRGIVRIEDRIPITLFDGVSGLRFAAGGEAGAAAGESTTPAASAANLRMMLMSAPANLLVGVTRDQDALFAQLSDRSVLAYDYARRRFVPSDAQLPPQRFAPTPPQPPAKENLPTTLQAGDREVPLVYAQHGKAWIALTRNGLRRFDRATKTFTPYERLGSDLADGSRYVRELVTDLSGRVWLIVQRGPRDNDSALVLAIEPDGRRRELPRDVRLRLGRVMHLQFDPGAAEGPVLWVVGYDALGRIDLARWTDADVVEPLAVNLRRAQIVGGAALPLGGSPVGIPHAARTLRFSFAAAHFPLSGRVEFQTWLEGLESGWSDWQPAAVRELTHLPVGRYTFRVRARVDGAVGEAVPYAFTVVPPWWRSGPALAAWALASVALIAGVVRWRGHRMRRRNEQLEMLVATRTTALRASEDQLRLACDAAEAANRAKSTFLAHMSHELRTPLNGILGYAQVLRRDPTQSEGARARLGVIVDSGEHLLALINEVLDLAKVEAGKMELRANDTSLERLARSVSDLVRAPCEEKGLRLDLQLAPGLPRLVRTDEQKLRQALLNLLGNAIKFTPGGANRRITLAIAPTADGRVRFAVADTGPGIAPERLPTLFTAFDSTATHGAHGTGLGLALSQRMVELLGGRIQVTSTPGKGSRFWFDLPLPEAAGAEPLAGSKAGRIVGYDGARRRVLVVDDEAVNRAVLRELLEPVGFTIEEAADEAATMVACGMNLPPGPPAPAPSLPDAILLDLRFAAGADGFAIARRLRAEPALAATKIIAVSASVFETDRHEALAAGCDAFLAKPFKAEQLLALLGTALGLEWRYAETAAPAPSGLAAPLAESDRTALLELARRGDAQRLRARLAKLGQTPAHAAFAQHLDDLVAKFQMKRIRELLSPPSP